MKAKPYWTINGIKRTIKSTAIKQGDSKTAKENYRMYKQAGGKMTYSQIIGKSK